MRFRFLAIVLGGLIGLSACDGAGTAASDEASAASDVSANGGVPAFALAYPGSVAQDQGVQADGVDGAGGLSTFTTDDPPQRVIDHYKSRAEAAGLEPSMAMSQGDALAYGATGANGATLQVVASPTEDGPTSVQLTWSAGS